MRIVSVYSYKACPPKCPFNSTKPMFKNLDASADNIALRRLAQASFTNKQIEKELREMNLI